MTDKKDRERESEEEPEDKYHHAGDEEKAERARLAERIAAEPELEEKDGS